ncbi:MAG: galactose mutarotase [Oscillospiraceae bacterium]|nr:galactose mutarotase [Oscillospiraceae bacterium]
MSNIRPFGTTPGGEPVALIQLDNDMISCQIITYGATIRSLVVPDRNGAPVDVVLGYDTLEEYICHDGYLGATIGRFANRIAGGRFQLNGQSYDLVTNDGKNHLHGGRQGFSHRVWSIAHCDTRSVTLSLSSPDGEEGYPGDLECSVRFELVGTSVIIHYHATSDRDTLCNLTDHSYFNLAGHDSGPVLDQYIQILAQNYTPSNEESIPLGTIEPVENTPMDLRIPTTIGKHIHEPFHQLIDARGYDHNYVVDGPIGLLRPAAVACAPSTGITMRVETTLPGVHFYTANYLPQGRMGKGGCAYGPRHGFCLETQAFPNAPNEPSFPSAVLEAGTSYDHRTVFCFTR